MSYLHVFGIFWILQRNSEQDACRNIAVYLNFRSNKRNKFRLYRVTTHVKKGS
ncbi:hypothetical protein SAMN05421780_105150 [Flexibacter flexilis DSM 6793]|uniref:Uncharacterized protein n=1 Tax=Flexibacter flexilis DSM 6793 TaxID=927664 RepID=A0A1I1J552_9BACT|nr:hypothetical protein SAMN05421780_105150 [Flexibacter flexilis DSM 6793]